MSRAVTPGRFGRSRTSWGLQYPPSRYPTFPSSVQPRNRNILLRLNKDLIKKAFSIPFPKNIKTNTTQPNLRGLVDWSPHVPKFGTEPDLTGLANLPLNENYERNLISRVWGIAPAAKLPDANLFLEFRAFSKPSFELQGIIPARS